MTGYASYLKKIPLFENLSPDQLKALAAGVRRQAFSPGQIIFEKNDPGDRMYIIRSGRVKIFTEDEAGKEIAINVYGPGEFFGEFALLDGNPRSTGAVAIEPTQTLVVRRGHLLSNIRKYPEIALCIISVLVARLRYTTEYAEGLAFLNVYGRVANKLLELADRYGVAKGEGVEIDMELRPERLASLAGVMPGTVDTILRSYETSRLLKVDGERITILDADRLRERVEYHQRKKLV